MATKQGVSADLLIPPGESLSDLLALRRMEPAELAALTGASTTYINRVLSGQQGISTDFAEALERVFNVPKSFWMNLQANYNAEMKGDVERGNSGPRI